MCRDYFEDQYEIKIRVARAACLRGNEFCFHGKFIFHAHFSGRGAVIMIGYVMVGASDLARSTDFYDTVLAPLGLLKVESTPDYVGYAAKTTPAEIEFYLTKPYNQQAVTSGNGTMIALVAESRSAVDRFHAVALESGGTDEGSPAPRPADGKIYYAYIRDPDGNKICAHVHDEYDGYPGYSISG